MASKRRACAWAFVLLLASTSAWAEPSAAQKETARSLMAEGRELRDKGDLEAALKRFNAADAIMGVPTTGFEIAATQVSLGRLVEARETLRRLLGMPQSASDPEPFNEARAKARALDQQLQQRIAALRFVVSGTNSDVELRVDGETLPQAVQGLPFRVNPGKHQVVARSSGREVERNIEAGEGETISVTLAFEAAPAPEPAPVVTPPKRAKAAPPPAPAEARGIPALTYVAGGIGVAGLVVGGITGVSAVSHKNAAQKNCVNAKCPPSTWSELDKASSMATVSTIGFVVGAVGLAVGVGSLLVSGKEPQRRALLVAPDVTPEGAHLNVEGTF